MDQTRLLRELFQPPSISGVQVSPKATKISFIAPHNGRTNLWVAPMDDAFRAQRIFTEAPANIGRYCWAHNDCELLVEQEHEDNTCSVSLVSAERSQPKMLLRTAGARAMLHQTSPRRPDEVLLASNHRDERFHDIYIGDIRGGSVELLHRNNGAKFIHADDSYCIRVVGTMAPDGSIEFQARGEGGWIDFAHIPSSDVLATKILGFDKSGSTVYMTDSRGRNTAALYSTKIDTHRRTLIATDERADICDVLIEPKTREIQATYSCHVRGRWRAIDPAISNDLRRLSMVCDGEFSIASQSQNGKVWVVRFVTDIRSPRYFLYRREKESAVEIMPAPTQRYCTMHSATFNSRDNLQLVSYFTLPSRSTRTVEIALGGAQSKPLAPTVLLVHGGPWTRDKWGFNVEHQWLAKNGYAVISVNFRGSTGLGKDFANAGDREWGGRMLEDLEDAAVWAIHERIADPNRIAIMGHSYGGYAALMSLIRWPKLFKCAISLNGPVDLVQFLETIPPYFAPMQPFLRHRVGDHQDDEGRKYLRECSPIDHLHKIRNPLLLAQGACDANVIRKGFDQIVKLVSASALAPITSAVFPDEGHTLTRTSNKLVFYSLAEKFLSTYLGGSGELDSWHDAFGSSAQVTIRSGSAENFR